MQSKAALHLLELIQSCQEFPEHDLMLNFFFLNLT